MTDAEARMHIKQLFKERYGSVAEYCRAHHRSMSCVDGWLNRKQTSLPAWLLADAGLVIAYVPKHESP